MLVLQVCFVVAGFGDDNLRLVEVVISLETLFALWLNECLCTTELN